MALDVQDRIRAMEAVESVQGLTDVAPDRIQRVPRRWKDPVRAGVCYFRIPDKRMVRGRITLLENGQNATERVMYRDYVMLERQYGAYHGANHPADWQRNDVYLGIIHAGGLHEFDAQQIVDLCWHYRPGRNADQSHLKIWEEVDRLIAQGLTEADAVCTVMPQLQGYDLTVQTCEKCGPERRFSTVDAVRQHRAIMHKDDVQTMGTRDAIAQALQSNGGANGLDKLVDAMAQMVEQNRLLMELVMAQRADAPRRGPGRPPKDAATDD